MQELIKELEVRYGKPISEFTEFDWGRTSRYQNLSEDFIRKFQDKLDWYYILRYQKVSKNFIKEFKEKEEEKIIKTIEYKEEVIKPKRKWYQFWKWFKK